jgi:hypothetical protein
VDEPGASTLPLERPYRDIRMICAKEIWTNKSQVENSGGSAGVSQMPASRKENFNIALTQILIAGYRSFGPPVT